MQIDEAQQPSVAYVDDETPTVSNVLSALDFEIDRITSERRRPGWSLWAVYGGLASAVWLLFDQIEKTGFRWFVVLQLFLVLSVSKELLLSFKQVMERSILSKSEAARFKFFSETERRVPLFLAILLNIGFLVIAIVTRTRVGWFSEIVMFIFLGGNVAFAISSFIRSFSRALIRVTQGFRLPFPYSLYGLSIELSINAIFSAAVIGYATDLVKSHPTVTDLRVASLLFVVSAFLPLLVREDEVVPLLSSLQNLRRDVALGRVPMTMAVTRMDEILVGMRAPRAFQEDLQEILDSIQSISSRSERLASTMSGFTDLLKTNSVFAENTKHGLAARFEDLFKPERDDIVKAKKGLDKKKASLRKRIDRLVRWEPVVRVELTDLLDSIQQREVTIDPAVDATSYALEALQQTLIELDAFEKNLKQEPRA